MFDRINARLVYTLLAVAALLTFSLSFLVVADVVGRVVFNSPVKGTPEIVSMSIVIICFLLAGYSVQSGGMLQADILVGLFGRRGPLISALLSGVLGAAFFGLIVWGSYEPALHAWSSGEFEGEGALRVPVWPARFVVMFGSLLVTIIYLGQAATAVVGLVRGTAPDLPKPPRRLGIDLMQSFDMIAIVVVVLTLVFAGVHIAIALGITAVLGIYLMLGDIEIVRTFVANTAYEALRDYVFAVIPLFMLMGDFLAKCGAARDLYALAHRFSRWLPAQLAVATILSNALFAFVTGVSIAAAAAFSRIAYPEMMRYGYRRDFALGCVAGSACLGMLIPPSVLMIVWAVLTEISIGKLFLAGVIPGLITAGGMIAYVVIAAIIKPELAGGRRSCRRGARSLGADVASPPMDAGPDRIETEEPLGRVLASTGLVVVLVLGVLAAIWFGVCTPTEGAGVGAVGALVLALIKGIILARGLAGHPLGRADLGAAASAAVLRAALFARAVDDRLHRSRQERS